MTTNAKIGHGSMFAIQGGSPLAYVPLAEVTNITPPALSRDAVDATHTASPEKWREFIAGMKDAGEVTVEMNFIPGSTSIDTILAAFNSDETQNCRITFPIGSPAATWSFSAIVTGFAPEAPMDGKMSASVTFKLTGKPGFVE